MNAAAAVSGQRLRASPIARRLAVSRGIALERIRGSGPGGRIVRLDVEALAMPPRPEVARIATPVAQPGAALRHAADIPVAALMALRSALSEGRPAPVSLDALLLKAVDLAFGTGDGLWVEEIALRSTGVATISRALTAGPTRLLEGRGSAARLWVTCIPEGGSDDAAPAGLVAGAAQLVLGAPAERVLPQGGAPMVLQAMRCSLVADDSVLDDARAAAFLARLRQQIEQPLGIVA